MIHQHAEKGTILFFNPHSLLPLRKPSITWLTQIAWAATSFPNLHTDTAVEEDTDPYILVKFHFTILTPLFPIAESFRDPYDGLQSILMTQMESMNSVNVLSGF